MFPTNPQQRHSDSHVRFPCVNYFWVGDFVKNGLIVEEIKHVLDGERQRTLAVRRTEYCLEQIIYKLLYCHLHINTPTIGAETSKHRPSNYDLLDLLLSPWHRHHKPCGTCLKYVKSMGRGFLLYLMRLSLRGYT